MDGGPGANIFEVLNPAWLGQANTGPGRHLLVTSRLSNPGAGDSNNVFIIEGGNATIAGLNLSKDAFWLPTFTNEPAVGHLGSSGTVIDFTGMDQKPASLYLQDIDFSSASLRNQYAPWLQWTGSSTT